MHRQSTQLLIRRLYTRLHQCYPLRSICVHCSSLHTTLTRQQLLQRFCTVPQCLLRLILLNIKQNSLRLSIQQTLQVLVKLNHVDLKIHQSTQQSVRLDVRCLQKQCTITELCTDDSTTTFIPRVFSILAKQPRPCYFLMKRPSRIQHLPILIHLAQLQTEQIQRLQRQQLLNSLLDAFTLILSVSIELVELSRYLTSSAYPRCNSRHTSYPLGACTNGISR